MGNSKQIRANGRGRSPAPTGQAAGRCRPRHSSSPSPARSEAPAPVPGKVQEGAESPFLVSASGGKKQNHFSSRRVRDEKSLSRSDVRKGSGPLGGRTLFAPKRSAKGSCLRHCRRQLPAIVPAPFRRWHGAFPRRNVPRYIPAKYLYALWSQPSTSTILWATMSLMA